MPIRTTPGKPPILDPISLEPDAGPGVTVQNTWVSLVKRVVPNVGWSYLEKLAYFAQTAGNTVTFQPYINGVPITDAYLQRASQYGQIGNAKDLIKPRLLPAGCTIEIKVYDTSAGGIAVECDGEINTYEDQF